jgi:hypothetical protein
MTRARAAQVFEAYLRAAAKDGFHGLSSVLPWLDWNRLVDIRQD